MQAEWPQLAEAFSRAVLQPSDAVPDGVNVATPKRFGVYRNNVNLSLINALESNFPAIRKLLGGAEFLRVAAQHARLYPPTSRLMFEYGENLPQELAADLELAGFPYLTDVAQLERLFLQSFNEDDAPVLVPAALSSVEPDVLFQSKFVAHPALRLLSSSYAVVSAWDASRDGRDLEGFDIAAAEFAIVTRPSLEVHVRGVSKPQFVFLSGLAAGECLGLAAEKATTHTDFDLASAISLLLQAGAYTAILSQD